MSQNTLIEKIKTDAAKAVEEIKAQGTAEIESIHSAVEADIADLKTTHQAQLEKKKAQLELIAVSKAKQSGKIAVQAAKREHIDAILDSVTEELTNQSPEEYSAFFSKLVSETVPKDVVIKSIHAPKKRSEETSKILSAAGLLGDVQTDDSISAGLVVHAEDGVYDVTLDRLMSDKRAELEMIIVNKVGA